MKMRNLKKRLFLFAAVLFPLLVSSVPTLAVELSDRETETTTTATLDNSDADEPETYDWNELSQYMSAQDTERNLDFAKARREYAVVVSVASSGADEECGSNENFYFQLVFENGSSAAVLANSQLPADGFRTGEDEIFFIKTNRDYGDLQSVRVIPARAGENRDEPFDKLKIDAITISETDESGVSEKWVVENVGWIGGDYDDTTAGSADDKGILSKTGKTIEQISNLYGVTSQGTTVNLFVCLTTANYGDEDNLVVQYEGTVKAQISYLSTSGMYRTRIFDLVAAIKDYNTAEAGFETVSMNEAYETESLMQSDPSRMFRANHTDRFVVTLEDCVSVSDLTLFCNATAETVWGIESASASLVTKAGKLSLNPNDEYVRSSESLPLCVNQPTETVPAYEVDCTGAGVSQCTIPFTENEILTNENTGERTIAQSGTDVSADDLLNLYIFPDESSGNASMDTYDILAAIQYADAYGAFHQVSADNTRLQKIGAGRESGAFVYATGLSGAGMASLSKLTMTARPVTGSVVPENAVIDHAIVQRVRGSVVLETSYFDIRGSISATERSAVPTSLYGKAVDLSTQTVTIQFADTVSDTVLRRGERDLSFRIGYTSSLAPNGEEMRSGFVSLTDLGITEIHGGKVVQIPFAESYVGAITSLSAAASGDLSATVEMAYATNVSSADNLVSAGYYSFAEPLNIEGFVSEERVTSDSRYGNDVVQPLRLRFVTGGADSFVESGTNGTVSLTIGYETESGAERVLAIPDASRYFAGQNTGGTGSASNAADSSAETEAARNGFPAGSTRDLIVLLRGAKDITYLTVTPNRGGWSLAEVTADLGDGRITHSRTVDERITTAGKRISMKDLYFSGAVSVRDSDKAETAKYTISATNPTAIRISSGETVRVTPKLTGGGSSNFTADCAFMDGDLAQETSGLIKTKNGVLTFTPPKNETGAGVRYRLTITSNEETDLSMIVFITVEPEVAAANSTDSGTTETPSETASDE